MKLESASGNVVPLGLLGTLSEQGTWARRVTPEPIGRADLTDSSLANGFKGRLREVAALSGRLGRWVLGVHARPKQAQQVNGPELTLPWLLGQHPKGSQAYRALVAEQEALKMLCKALKLIRFGARRPYARAAQALLEEKVEGQAAHAWVLGHKHKVVRGCEGEGIEHACKVIANALNGWAQKAYDLIRDTYARVPLVEAEPVAATWLGPANSPERLGNLHRALERVRDGDLPWTTTLTAAKLLDVLFQGISIQHWVGQSRAAVYWLGRADQSRKMLVAQELERWADEAFRFLDRAAAKYGLDFI